MKKARKKRRASPKEETEKVGVAEAVSEADVVDVDSAVVVVVDTIDPDVEAAAEVVDDPSVRVMEERTPVRAKARETKNEANEDRLAAVEVVVGGAPAVVVAAAVDAATRDVSTEVVVVEVVALDPPKVAGVVNNPVMATKITTELMKALPR